MESSDEFLEFRAEIFGVADDGFVVDSDSKAEWCLEKISAAEAAKTRRAKEYEAQVNLWQRWREKGDTSDDHTIEHMTALLRPYFDVLLASGVLGKHKSYRLPSGRIGTRQAPVDYQIDEAKLLEWAKPLGLVRTKEVPAWDLIKTMIEPEADHAFAGVREKVSQQAVPGVTVRQPEREVFKVTMNVG